VFKSFKKVIIIGGVPRSGTSWLGQIFDSSPEVRFRFQPLFSYAFKGRLSHESTAEEIRTFLEDLYQSQDDFLLQTDKRKSGQYPIFTKAKNENILVFKENRYQNLFAKFLNSFEDLKFVGIIRNPCAVLNSWIKNPREFPPGSEIQKEWRMGQCKNEGREEEFFGYYKWKEIANLYLDLKDKWPTRVSFLRFEDLVGDTEKEVNSIFDFEGLQMQPQTRDFLLDCNLRIVDTPYSVFKPKTVKDAWRNELPQTIVEEIYADLSGTRLEQFLI
jgi:hypothetical protein